MSSSIGLTPRYALTIGASFLFWIVPINVKAPKFVTFLGFLASGCGYLYAFSLATPMSDQRWYTSNKRIQEREVLMHDLALEEMSLKQAIEAQYLGQAEMEPAAIVAAAQQHLQGQPQLRQLPSEATLPPYLQLIIQLAQANGGVITVREVMRAPGVANQFSSDQVKSFFQELAERGKGTLKSERNSIKFQLS